MLLPATLQSARRCRVMHMPRVHRRPRPRTRRRPPRTSSSSSTSKASSPLPPSQGARHHKQGELLCKMLRWCARAPLLGGSDAQHMQACTQSAHACIRARVRAHTHTHTCTHTLARAHTHTHTHPQARTHARARAHAAGTRKWLASRPWLLRRRRPTARSPQPMTGRRRHHGERCCDCGCCLRTCWLTGAGCMDASRWCTRQCVVVCKRGGLCSNYHGCCPKRLTPPNTPTATPLQWLLTRLDHALPAAELIPHSSHPLSTVRP